LQSHGSQDLYPTLLGTQNNFNANEVTLVQVTANLGAITGGTVIGYCSQIFGRRFSIIVMCILGGALLYPYGYLRNNGIYAAAFFEQFCVQGAWGVIPIHLMELSPASFRTFVVGTAYQLGNLVSSASSTIEATISERFPLPPTATGTPRFQYGKVIAIFMGCVYVYVIILTIAGPERKGRGLHVRDDNELAEAVLHRHGHIDEETPSGKRVDGRDGSLSSGDEKRNVEQVEST
jgi:SHS family lactate transporter-like MFS transporter